MNNYTKNTILTSSLFKEEIQYWLKKLEGEVIMSDFTHDYFSSDNKMNDLEYEFPQNIFDKIKSICSNSEYSIFIFLACSVNLLYFKYMNNNEIIFGMPNFKKDIDKKIERENIIPIKTILKNSYSIRDCLKEITNTIVNAKKHSNMPFEVLGDLIDIDLSEKPADIFKVIVLLENIHESKYLSKLNTNLIFDFNIINNKLTLKLKYNELIYRKDTVKCLINHLVKVLELSITSYNMSLINIDILSEEEKNKVIFEFNYTKDDNNILDKSFNEVFQQVVNKHGEKTAVIYNDDCITYNELNEKSNQLARRLINEGIKREDIVGIMLERSIKGIISLLAVIKAGAAYLPIDPDYPQQRIEYMVSDSNTGIIITTLKYKNKLKLKSKILYFDDGSSDNFPKYNLENINNINDLIYVIYTSGTTGVPKGVMVEHKNLISMADSWKKEYNLDLNPPSLLQLASFSFDVFTGDITRALLNGGKLIICSNEKRYDFRYLYQLINKYKVNIFESTPSLIIPLMNYIYKEKLDVTSLKVLILGSDILSFKDFYDLKKRFGSNMRIINSYGVTEATIDSSYYETNIEDLEKSFNLPIGRPMKNVKMYVVDDEFRAVPIGVKGNLCIGGAGVSRGYINKVKLNKERFINSPFIPGERLYSTGDVARWRSDGNIELLGRTDSQVKIHGYRIEIKEIENVILGLDYILEVAVLVCEEKNSKYICAYLVSNQELTSKKLKDDLRGKLPLYMIPSYFIQIDRLILNINGKVDKKQLPSIEMALKDQVEYIEPKTEKQFKVYEVWKEILDIEHIGIDDNFFDLGGDSIKAMKVVLKLAKEYDIGMNSVFTYQTIRTLSEKLPAKSEHIKEIINKINKKDLVMKSKEHEALNNKMLDLYNVKNKIYDKMDLSSVIEYKNIIVFGSTGYLGVHLVKELLLQINTNIILLIRGKSNEEALERFKKKYKFYFKEDLTNVLKKRIKVFSGDLSNDKFGLEDNVYKILKNSVDCIINVSGKTEHFGNYEDFFAINVKGVEKLITFAMDGIKKSLNHISTISIASGVLNKDASEVFTEYDCNIGQEIDNMYLGTKFEAEKLLISAREKGLNVNIFRVGNLVFNYDTGIFQENISKSKFYKIFRSLIMLRTIPMVGENSLKYDFSFVDYTSKSISLLFNRKNIQNENFHLYNSNLVDRIELSKLLKEIGFEINVCSIEEFTKSIYDYYEKKCEQQYIEDIIMNFESLENIYQTKFNIRSDKTEMILEKLGFKWPVLDTNELKKMIDYCKCVNFINE